MSLFFCLQEQLKAEVASLNSRWEQVVSLAREQDERLNGRLSSSQNLYDKLESLMEWLTALKQDLTNKDYSVDSPSDLQVKCKKFKVSYPRLSITIQCCL